MAIINEENARIAKQLSSFSDYVEGSATASYNAQCAKAAAILEQVKPKCATADQRERPCKLPCSQEREAGSSMGRKPRKFPQG